MRACITGYGVIDCLGSNPATNFSNLLNQQDYSSEIDFNYKYISVNRGFKPTAILAEFTSDVHQSMTNAMGMFVVEEALRHANVTVTENVAVIMSSVTGGNELRWEATQQVGSHRRISPKKSLNIMADSLSSIITEKYKFNGVNLSLASACSTGIMSLDYAIKICNEYDYVIAGGSDFTTNPYDTLFFNTLGALANESMPFDDKRSGFVVGSGAAALIIESEEKAKARGANILAYIYPSGNASDGEHRTTPNGNGARLSIKKALQNANIDTVDFVNAHATSTPAGDEIEYKAIIDTVGNVPIYSCKGKIGHTMAAAGAIETIYSIESMRQQIIPHNHNLNKCSFDLDQLLVRNNTKFKKNKVYTLNNSFGFGGKCSSQVIEVNNV